MNLTHYSSLLIPCSHVKRLKPTISFCTTQNCPPQNGTDFRIRHAMLRVSKREYIARHSSVDRLVTRYHVLRLRPPGLAGIIIKYTWHIHLPSMTNARTIFDVRIICTLSPWIVAWSTYLNLHNLYHVKSNWQWKSGVQRSQTSYNLLHIISSEQPMQSSSDYLTNSNGVWQNRQVPEWGL